MVLLLTLACASTAIPTSSPDTISTIVAATMAAVTPATAQPSPTIAAPTLLQPTSNAIPPTALPLINLTAALPDATRITFLPGATTGIMTGSAGPGQSINYVLQASQGQILMVNVDSTNHDVTVSIKTQGGTSMLSPATQQSTWQQALPQTEDYYLTLHGGTSQENYTLTVTIPSRLKFAPGEDKLKVSGKTAGGYAVSYAIFAIKGQKMIVDLSPISGDAALTIYGYVDGTPYVRYVSEQTSFRFKLPSTQDYIIQVVPRAGSEVPYVLVVQVQ